MRRLGADPVAHHHDPLDGLAAGQELGLGQHRWAAPSGVTPVATPLPLGLQPGRAVDALDLAARWPFPPSSGRRTCRSVAPARAPRCWAGRRAPDRLRCRRPIRTCGAGACGGGGCPPPRSRRRRRHRSPRRRRRRSRRRTSSSGPVVGPRRRRRPRWPSDPPCSPRPRPRPRRPRRRRRLAGRSACSSSVVGVGLVGLVGVGAVLVAVVVVVGVDRLRRDEQRHVLRPLGRGRQHRPGFRCRLADGAAGALLTAGNVRQGLANSRSRTRTASSRSTPECALRMRPSSAVSASSTRLLVVPSARASEWTLSRSGRSSCRVGSCDRL